MNLIITSNPEIMDGTPVFAGTRVPVETFTEYLETGSTIDEFLRDFPTVTRGAVFAFLEEARERLATEAAPAHFV